MLNMVQNMQPLILGFMALCEVDLEHLPWQN